MRARGQHLSRRPGDGAAGESRPPRRRKTFSGARGVKRRRVANVTARYVRTGSAAAAAAAARPRGRGAVCRSSLLQARRQCSRAKRSPVRRRSLFPRSVWSKTPRSLDGSLFDRVHGTKHRRYDIMVFWWTLPAVTVILLRSYVAPARRRRRPSGYRFSR